MAINYFQLPDGVRVAKNLPIDGDRYIANDISARDSIITAHRAFTGLQVYVTGGTAEEIGLYVLETLVEWVPASCVWTKIGETDTLSGGTGIYLNTGTTGIIEIENTKYVSGVTINSLSNVLTITLADGTTETTNLGYLVDSDSYVCGGTYDPRSGGTIDFVTNSGFTFSVSGISNASMDSLSDTILTNPQDNQILVYTGGTWINSANTASGTNDWLDNPLTANTAAGGVQIGDFFPSGTTFESMFLEILAPELAPTLTNYSLTLNNVPSSAVEIGTYLSFTLSDTFNQGIIDSKDSHPDINYVGSASATTYSGSGTVDSSTGVVTHTATTSNSWQVDVDYYATGGSYYTSRSNESHIFDNVHLNSGTTSATDSVTGYYNYYYGSSGTTMPTGSTVRNLDHAFRTSDTFNFSYDIPSGEKYTAFYVEGPERKIDVKYVQSSNAQMCSSFNATAVTIPDANGSGVTYYKYEMYTNGYTALATYNVTIGGIGSGCA